MKLPNLIVPAYVDNTDCTLFVLRCHHHRSRMEDSLLLYLLLVE